MPVLWHAACNAACPGHVAQLFPRLAGTLFVQLSAVARVAMAQRRAMGLHGPMLMAAGGVVDKALVPFDRVRPSPGGRVPLFQETNIIRRGCLSAAGREICQSDGHGDCHHDCFCCRGHDASLGLWNEWWRFYSGLPGGRCQGFCQKRSHLRQTTVQLYELCDCVTVHARAIWVKTVSTL